MNLNNWELTCDLGFTFEFTNKKDENITIRLMANNEKEAWKKLESIS